MELLPCQWTVGSPYTWALEPNPPAQSCFHPVPSVSRACTAISSGFLLPLSQIQTEVTLDHPSLFKLWHARKYWATSNLGRRALTEGLCQLLWCSHAFHGWSQAPNTRSPNAELRKVHSSPPAMRQHLNHADATDITARAQGIRKCHKIVRKARVLRSLSTPTHSGLQNNCSVCTPNPDVPPGSS